MLAFGMELSSSTRNFIPFFKVNVFTSSAFGCAKHTELMKEIQALFFSYEF